MCALANGSVALQNQPEKCGFFLAPSTLAGGIGRGVFAGRNYTKDEKIDTMITVTIPFDILWDGEWSLRNYVFAHDEDSESMAVFGVAMLFNHRHAEKVLHYWDEHEIAKTSDSSYTPSSVMSHVVFETALPVQTGEELYCNYGGSGWFQSRGLTLVDETLTSGAPEREKQVPSSFLHEYGFCLDHVEFKPSTKPIAGTGLFAKKAFKKGEIVTISPVLALPAPEIELFTVESVIQNYCISAPGSQVAILPIGYGAGINHDANASLVMDWYDGWKSTSVAENLGSEFLRKSLELDTGAILSVDYSPLDLKYTATRDIAAGEELTVNYGEVWVEAWAEYLAKSLEHNSRRTLSTWEGTGRTGTSAGSRSNTSDGHGKNIGDPPLFRKFMQAPAGLFPEQWNLPDPRRPLLYAEEYLEGEGEEAGKWVKEVPGRPREDLHVPVPTETEKVQPSYLNEL